MSTSNLKSVLLLAVFTLVACGQRDDDVEQSAPPKENRISAEALRPDESGSPYPSQVFWGDTHLHTSNSIDAFGFGNRLDTEAALRFARGEQVTSTKSPL